MCKKAIYRKIEVLEFETLQDALDFECGEQAGYYCSEDCPMLASTGCALTMPKEDAEAILLRQPGWEKVDGGLEDV